MTNPYKKLSLGVMVLAGILVLGQVTLARINNGSSGGVSAPVSIANGGTGLTSVGASSTVLTTDGAVAKWETLAGSGTVTSLSTTYPITGGPITTTGTLALAFGTTTANTWAATQAFTSVANFNGWTNNGSATTTFLTVNSGFGLGTTTSGLATFSLEQGTELNSFWVGNQGSSSPSLMIRGVNGMGRVGIATSTPLATLDVAGSIVSEEASTTAPATTVIDWSLSNQHRILIPNSITSLTFSNGQAGGGYRLVVCQGSAGSKTISWPTNILWSGGTAPTLTTTANKCDLITFTATYATTSQLWFMGGSVLNF